MQDDNDIAVRILAHRQNLRRYRALLRSPLTEVERDFIDRRIGEEEAELVRLDTVRQESAAAAVPQQADGQRRPAATFDLNGSE